MVDETMQGICFEIGGCGLGGRCRCFVFCRWLLRDLGLEMLEVCDHIFLCDYRGGWIFAFWCRDNVMDVEKVFMWWVSGCLESL